MSFSNAGMSVGTSVIRPLASQHDQLAELRQFMAGTSETANTHPLELTRRALSLLKTFPTSRDFVLEYFCSIFCSAVDNHINAQAIKAVTSKDEETVPSDEVVISEIHSVLCNFVSYNPEAWAPTISSCKYSKQVFAQTNGGLNEGMQLWMSCPATRTLIDINTQCLSCLMHSNTDACISALLDTSVRHSPHFDWVVAHVGSCFPHTVITRVLSCGLRDFAFNGDQSCTAKLNSVVGILGHLAGSHFADIRKALLELFQWSMKVNEDSMHMDTELMKEQSATVPYLLKLAALSPTLLRALSADVLQSLNSDVLDDLAQNKGKLWLNFFESEQILLDLVVHLMLNSEEGSDHLITLLLQSSEHPNHKVQSTSLYLLELLILEADQLIRIKRASVAFLNCVQKKLSLLQQLLLSKQPLHLRTAVRLLTLLGQQNPSVLPGIISHALMQPMTDEQRAAAIEVVRTRQDQECFAQSITLALRSCHELETGMPEHLWNNLEKLIKNENHKKVTLRSLWPNLGAFATSLSECSSPETACTIATVLDLVLDSAQEELSTQLILWLIDASVTFFYNFGFERSKGIHTASQLLQRLSSGSNVNRAIALRELLESALFQPPSYLFGATGQIPTSYSTNSTSFSLLEENQKQGTSSLIAHRHSSVFHAGIIGSGLRNEPTVPEISEHQIAVNTQSLVAMLRSCCLVESTQESLDAVISLALLLVELVSPDVMYNGLPWPEEEFCKVTVERDLCIRRLFNTLPLLWWVLRFIASHRPALCYCSVLLRAVAATLIGQWSTAGQQRQTPGHDPRLVSTTRSLLQVMALGQLLPPPLSSLADIVPHLPPFQVVSVLRDCVWNYMRDHVPSPALFARDSSGVMWRDPALARPAKQYTETLRIIMQKNIAVFGPLYSLLFLNSTIDS
ncbi:hypothetical protein LSTR_LSTR012053 [Laodelphax striatellus]|uniref:Integrator complex subunit 5 C-terminal domain-containing protein n=2 Tax=Laodelphax striatellus TaxID=195883 RepID=A0A482WQ61_LAOST|nr:hypothetical protein LSTR_LSTR012053 [Laodelphax striatellus]